MADARLKNRYKVDRYPMAHDGMGEVWPAHDELLDRDVIIKSVNVAMMDVELVRRFRREARLTASSCRRSMGPRWKTGAPSRTRCRSRGSTPSEHRSAAC